MAILTITPAATSALTVSAWDSLADGAWASSTQVDNTSTDYVDALVGGVIATDNTNLPTANGTFNIYVAATYSDTDTDVTSALDSTGAIGTAGEALTEGKDGEFIKENLILLTVVSVGDTTLTAAEFIHWGPVSVASAFSGVMPRKWTLIMHNDSGGDVETTGTTCDFTGIQYTSTQ